MVSGDHNHHYLAPTAHVVSWSDPPSLVIPPPLLAALRQYLAGGGDAEVAAAEADEEFMMYEFKVRRCARARSHDWTACPYAHPGEAARRRDPRRVGYSGELCPDFKSRGAACGACPRGFSCPFAHGTFELWLHPARYRTRPCRSGAACSRRVCFFAHAPEELRSPAKDEMVVALSPSAACSPKSTLATLWESPPVSPVEGRRWVEAEEAEMDMEMEALMLSMQEFSVRNARRPATPVLPPAAEEDGPDLGWVSELVM